MVQKDKIASLVNNVLENEQHFLVDVRISGSEGKQKIIILLDGDEGISIDDCATVSRKLANRIEEQDLIQDAYILEVSSPGIDFPLASERQYKKNIGRTLKIVLNDGTTHTGVLQEVSNTGVLIEEEVKQKGKKAVKQPLELPYSNIKSTNVLVSFK
jgi:ribosome maturation factor RimP